MAPNSNANLPDASPLGGGSASPLISELIKVGRGAVHGYLYGAKVRAPHALVMTVLFKRNLSILKKMQKILKLTATHATNLGIYVGIYKLATLVLKRTTSLNNGTRAAVSGAIGGAIMFGKKSSVNTQVNLYVFSRVAMAIGRLLLKWDLVPSSTSYYRLWAALTWAAVMALFVTERDEMQGSLVASMVYLYEDSDTTGKTISKLL
ncbi:hypothetical protein AAMO2058_000745500 [Amorphochlora amoebiformis]